MKTVEANVSSQPDNTAAIAKLVTEIGPDIAEISRRLGQYKETVRYRYKEKIAKRGFQIKADLDYGALGLRRMVMKLRFADQYASHSHTIFDAMSELCYLVAYAGTTPRDTYIAHGAVPAEFTSEFRSFMESLREEGIFSSVEVFECDWFRVMPMRADSFNFDEGIWDFDWTNPPPVDDKAARAAVTEPKRVDKLDLLLLKELWKNSDRSLTEILEAIEKVNGVEVNYKTLAWHYARHVQGERLVRDYSIAWHGMKYNADLQRTERVGKYGYLGVSLIVKDPSVQENMMLKSALNRLPFLWSEASGEVYYSQLFFPLGAVNEALDYLKELLRPYGERAEIFLLDRREMTSFTISYALFDERRGRWTFDRGATLPRLGNAVLKIGERRA